MKIYGVILAAGSGRRVGADKNKVFLPIAGRTVLEHTLEAFKKAGCFHRIYIVCKPREKGYVGKLAKAVLKGDYELVPGGAERQDSVKNALDQIPSQEEDIIAIHDGARCLVQPAFINKCVKSAIRYGSGVAAKRATDTVKLLNGDQIEQTLDRNNIALMETPQVFRADIIKRAYAKAYEDGYYGTDECALAERLGISPKIVTTHKNNLKITNRHDFKLGEFYLMNDNSYRVGHGFDAHRLAEGRRLVLGGVEIPYEKGLDGHSDADVLVHAVIDALLGAAGLPDIGRQFPDTDEAYRGISSIQLLERTAELMKRQGFTIGNVDCTLILQRPKVAAYTQRMEKNMADALGAADERIHVKATTTEGMGFTGDGQGIAASAVCFLIRHPGLI